MGRRPWITRRDSRVTRRRRPRCWSPPLLRGTLASSPSVPKERTESFPTSCSGRGIKQQAMDDREEGESEEGDKKQGGNEGESMETEEGEGGLEIQDKEDEDGCNTSEK